MDSPTSRERDPIGWCALIAAGFLGVVWHRLFIPSKIYFDEVHYVPAARKLLDLVPANLEHPMFGKDVLAASIWLLGDDPHGWRIPSALFGAFGLFAFGRLIWWASAGATPRWPAWCCWRPTSPGSSRAVLPCSTCSWRASHGGPMAIRRRAAPAAARARWRLALSACASASPWARSGALCGRHAARSAVPGPAAARSRLALPHRERGQAIRAYR